MLLFNSKKSVDTPRPLQGAIRKMSAPEKDQDGYRDNVEVQNDSNRLTELVQHLQPIINENIMSEQ